ncbi:hypothetical protein [Glutamicibacter sp. X7]
MTAVITLSDPDNRADDCNFVMTAPVQDCIPYLLGPVTNDTLPASRWVIRAAVQALLSGRFAEAKHYARQVGIYLSAESNHVEAVTVQELGDGGDFWVVTGTTDAHSAEEAVRAHCEWLYGDTLEELAGEDHVELRVSRQELMRWSNLNDEGKADDGSRLLRRDRWALASRDEWREWLPLSAPFDGFMVQA